jgi:hypothetical protein
MEYSKNCEQIIDPTHGKSLLLKDLNIFLTGVDQIPLSTCKILLLDKKIIFKRNNNLYLKLEKYNEYLDTIGSLENFQDKYLLINYYKLINKDLKDIQKDISEFFTNFIKYLTIKNSIDSNLILSYIGNNYLKAHFVNNEYDLFTIKFNTDYDPIIFTFGYNNLDSKNIYINLQNIDYKECNKRIYKNIVTKFLLNKPDQYIVKNLTKLIGNKSFAKLIYSSHELKNEYTIDIDIIDFIIHYKNVKCKNMYIYLFLLKYKNKNIYEKQNDGTINLNFEGFQKYLLNLSEDYLISFDMKEYINDMYYNITDELIRSYKELYKLKLN